MSDTEPRRVYHGQDFLGFLEAPGPDASGFLRIRTEKGDFLRVPASLLKTSADGRVQSPMSLRELEMVYRTDGAEVGQGITVPVVAEQVRVEKRTVETGVIRVRKTIREEVETVDEPLLQERVSVERIPVDRIWEGPLPEPRQEGDTLIIPVLEEVLVVRKELRLKEEIRIRREQEAVSRPQQVVLKQENVTIERSWNASEGS
ncbi:MAG: YsnF/AvaK domain-containing protein [Capsulimonadales bacterium]|nr:YsnF/AvaK domain-containing protein [Capsulimonadales bacterium]